MAKYQAQSLTLWELKVSVTLIHLNNPHSEARYQKQK